MILRNYTPFAPLLFQSRDVDGRELWTLILRGTFRVVPFAPLALDPDQQPVVETDVFHGEMNASSVRLESDIVAFKPRADIHIRAVARAPGGFEAPSWVVRARVGGLEKALRVTGPRRWVKEESAWRLTDPEPCAEVPMLYENAYGGVWQNAWGDASICEENPLGVGYLKEGQLPAEGELRAPRIEALDDPIGPLGKAHKPEGLGPISRAWQPRRSLAGTFDDAWKRERWPELPVDFSFEHYNSAHPDLIYPGYLAGDEEVSLENLDPSGGLRFFLPGYELLLLLRLADGPFVFASVNLDTLSIDVPEGRAFLTWRAVFLELAPIRVIEARMTYPGAPHGG